jgi:hypothetical protein
VRYGIINKRATIPLVPGSWERDIRPNMTYYYTKGIEINTLTQANPEDYLERGRFVGDTIMDLFVSTLAIFAFTLMGIEAIVSGDFPIINLLICIFFGFIFSIGILVSLVNGRRATIGITDTGGFCREGDDIVEVLWGPDVTADVEMHPMIKSETHGPLQEILLYNSETGFTIATYSEWTLEDIRSAWPAFIRAVREHDLKIGDGLREYLEYRKEHGLDN